MTKTSEHQGEGGAAQSVYLMWNHDQLCMNHSFKRRMQILSDLTTCLKEIYMAVMYSQEFHNAYAMLMCYLANLRKIIHQSERISPSFIFFFLLPSSILQNV